MCVHSRIVIIFKSKRSSNSYVISILFVTNMFTKFQNKINFISHFTLFFITNSKIIRWLIYSFGFIFRLERSRVKVSFFQSSKPQQISPPSSDHQFYFGDNYFNNNSLIDSFLNEADNKMTAVIPDYDRQIR